MNDELKQVQELKSQGLTRQAICRETGLSFSRVKRLLLSKYSPDGTQPLRSGPLYSIPPEREAVLDLTWGKEGDEYREAWNRVLEIYRERGWMVSTPESRIDCV